MGAPLPALSAIAVFLSLAAPGARAAPPPAGPSDATSREFIAAAKDGRVDDVQRLLLDPQHPGLVYSTDTVGATALLWAAANGNAAVVDVLLAASPRPRLDARTTYNTIVYPCAAFESPGVGADTALHLAAVKGFPFVKELIDAFVQAKISRDLYDSQGATPLGLAACGGNADAVRLLLENGSDPNANNSPSNAEKQLYTEVDLNKGKTPLDFAAAEITPTS